MEELKQILSLARFPRDAAAYVVSVYEKVESEPELSRLLSEAEACYLQGDECLELRKELAEKSGIHPYSIDLLLLVCCFRKLRVTYREKDWSEELFAETLADLRYKLEECRMVYGIDGNFVFHWYRGFFDCTRFKLGRLQYEPYILESGYKDIVPPGGTVYKCHIPMAGPLTPELVTDSLEKARAFYKPDGPLVVFCASWLLYPDHYALYPEGSNLRKFYDLFDVYKSKVDTKGSNAWRVFGTKETDAAKLPRNTSLQKAFQKYLSEGHEMGTGYGILIYDPEK